jgi:hypothetical protein
MARGNYFPLLVGFTEALPILPQYRFGFPLLEEVCVQSAV